MRPHIAVSARRRPRQYRVRSLMLAVALCAAVAWTLRHREGRALALVAVTAVALPVLLLGFMMGLAWLGFAGAWVLERAAGWVRRAASFPDDPAEAEARSPRNSPPGR